MDLSVVIPVYKNESTLKDLVDSVLMNADKLYRNVECIFVIDGSPDNSRDLLWKFANEDSRIKVISFARNFGQHTAIIAGLERCNGDNILVIDADLEEPIDKLKLFKKRLDNGFEIVVGKRVNPRSNLFKHYSAKFYTYLYNILSEYKIIGNTTNMRLMTKRYANFILLFSERPFLGGFCSWIGLPIGIVDVPWIDKKRSSSYNLGKLLSHGRVGLIGFSGKIMRLSLMLGILVSSLCIIFSAYIIIRHLLYNDLLTGYPSIMVAITLLIGVLFILIGVLGEYVHEIFKLTKNRPNYLIFETKNI